MASAEVEGRIDGAPAAAKGGRALPVMCRREIEGLIADGRAIIIVNQEVLKVDGWMGSHPGGDKPIRHMIGKDATDEVTAMHSEWARGIMNRYRIGRIEGRWKNFNPPEHGGVFRPYFPADDASDSESSPADSSNSSTIESGLSRSPSPVFDVEEPGEKSTVRNRFKADPNALSQTTTASELEPEELPEGIVFLDSLTRKEIDIDLAAYPAVDAATQEDIVAKYRVLHDQIRAEGLYNCNYRAYAVEVTRYTLLFTGMVLLLRAGWYACSAVVMGMFWHQLLFTAHDAGHIGITHNYQVDTIIGIFVGNFLGGLSLGWWKSSHNVHHIITNLPEHDPDIQYPPLIAITHRYFKSLRSTYYERVLEYDALYKFLVPMQHYLFYVLLTFGRFNLYRLAFSHILFAKYPKKGPARFHRYIEMAGVVFFWYWYGYVIIYQNIEHNWGRFVFIMLSHMVTMPLHAQLTLSHFAMSTADLGPEESFPQRMLRTTMDVDCPPWLDFFHGGLQFQAIHHLYPRIPRHNLRRTKDLVMEFCAETKIPYAMLGFVDGNKLVVGRLAEVARQATFLARCEEKSASVAAAGGHVGHHH